MNHIDINCKIRFSHHELKEVLLDDYTSFQVLIKGNLDMQQQEIVQAMCELLKSSSPKLGTQQLIQYFYEKFLKSGYKFKLASDNILIKHPLKLQSENIFRKCLDIIHIINVIDNIIQNLLRKKMREISCAIEIICYGVLELLSADIQFVETHNCNSKFQGFLIFKLKQYMLKNCPPNHNSEEFRRVIETILKSTLKINVIPPIIFTTCQIWDFMKILQI